MPQQPIRLTPRLCRAARAMLGWRQADLFEASKVPAPTIEAFEAKPESARMMGANMRALIAAFEAAGLEFIPENGGGAGIRFRDANPVSAVRTPKPPYSSMAEKAAMERAERRERGEPLPGDEADEAVWQEMQAEHARMRGRQG